MDANKSVNPCNAKTKEQDEKKYVSPCKAKTKEQEEAEKSACFHDPCKPKEVKCPPRERVIELPCPDSPEQIKKRERLKRESEEICFALKNPALAAAKEKMNKKKQVD